MDISRMRPALVMAFVGRQVSVPSNCRSANDAWNYFLAQRSAAGKTTSDKTKHFLGSNGGSGKSTSDLWGSYLVSKGFTGNKDGMRKFLLTGTA